MRREDPNLDRGVRLRAGGDRPQAARAGGKPLSDSTDFDRDALRETPILRALQPFDTGHDLLDLDSQLILTISRTRVIYLTIAP
jgi:hypothetical protein